MGRAVFLVAALMLTACGSGSGGDDVSVEGRVTSSSQEGTSTGGASVGVNVKGLSLHSPWRIGEPFKLDTPIPPTDLAAQGEALLFTGPEERLIDAVATPLGTVALVRDGDGFVVVRLLPSAGDRSAPLPAAANRILLAGIDPLDLRVLFGDGFAVTVRRR
jgi:hypothetical protein